MIHFHLGPDISADNPHTGIFITILLALTTVITSGVSFLQNLDLISGIILKFVGICAGISTIYAAYWTVQASKAKLK